ncbi:MAG: hypothetical protein MUC99_04570 [Anaerolineae bacterium]|jgi:hypothetical protein|nr:hypothetical protein [Anaerolineae bacterium]
MEIPLFDMGGSPQPRSRVKIESVGVTPYPDRFRVFVEIKVSPFLERPNLLLTLHDDDDTLVSELNIIETMHNAMEFTMHIRNKPEPAGAYALTVELFYETRNPPQQTEVVGFLIPPYDPAEDWQETYDDEPAGDSQTGAPEAGAGE